VGSVFVSIFEVPSYGILSGTLARIGFGCAIILIAYGILKRRRVALLGFAALVVLSVFTNPVLAFLLAGALVFLLSHRRHFHGARLLSRMGL
jgi:phosphate/sulfate permease